jgi:acyl-CoA synthetase (AMP-forming)/AMP-acid ligase II
MMDMTLHQLMARGDDGSVALAAPGMASLTFGRLRQQIIATVEMLNRVGIGRNDRVAIVLDNGPAMATAFLAIASGVTAAPLNPGYREDEFAFYLKDLRAKALVVASGSESPALAAATKLDIPLLMIEASGEAGHFSIATVISETEPEQGGLAEPDDIALVLHTSGTTSRPKIVPLSHRNVCASGRNIATTLCFSRDDRGLGVMPLFHIHGLIAGIVAPLSMGGSVFCTPGFNALRFFGWMEEARPTWYTAVPTMHQAILDRAGSRADLIRAVPLRFIRSSSASLPPTVLERLERIFGTPVIEAYGMTEAAHQMASNLLPPGERKPGSVGVAGGPEVAIMGNGGRLLPAGETGEIVIRGDNVTAGYESNPEANATAFTGGWFRTGDQGMLDADGFLRITGRLKEIINRGGEKVSPREVDEVLLTHPGINQAVCFAISHPKLGEEIGAAVVLHRGAEASEPELREFVGGRLADFKVPRRIVILDEIPKGPTGKVQRIGLAKKLGLQ